MKIKHKSIYSLLDRRYSRSSSLAEFIKHEFPDTLVHGAMLFAQEKEDYQFLIVMKSKKFVLFFMTSIVAIAIAIILKAD